MARSGPTGHAAQMTLTDLQPRNSTRWPMGGVVAAVVCVLLVLAGWAVGRQRPEVHTAEVRCLSAVGTISCELDDDWTISVPLDVGWSSPSGGDHLDGRPDCLPPTGRGLEGPVEVSWIPVEVHGRSWRHVVWVTCLR